MKKILSILFLLLCFAGGVQAQDIHVQFSPPFVPVIGGVPFRAWNVGSQTFIFALSPQSAVNLYLTNNGGASHGITITTFTTGNSGAADFTNNQAQWVSFKTVNIASGASSGSQVLTILANSTAVLTTGLSNAAQIAIQLSAADNSTDTFTLTAVLTPNGITGLTTVTGPKQANTASGCPACFPVLIAGQDGGGNTTVFTVLNGLGVPGLVIDSSNSTVTGVTPGVQFLGSNVGKRPLAIQPVDNSTSAVHITTATTTTTNVQNSELKTIIIGHPIAASTITVKDGANTIAILDSALQAIFPFNYWCAQASGCSIVTSAATDVTAIVSQ